jgi:hypothetical protein
MMRRGIGGMVIVGLLVLVPLAPLCALACITPDGAGHGTATEDASHAHHHAALHQEHRGALQLSAAGHGSDCGPQLHLPSRLENWKPAVPTALHQAAGLPGSSAADGVPPGSASGPPGSNPSHSPPASHVPLRI